MIDGPHKFMLAKVMKEGFDPTGWMMSEKLDGMRALWDGNALRTRNNKQIYTPRGWGKDLPLAVNLDGELYMGRGLFQRTVSVVRRHEPEEDRWKEVQFHIFDAPGLVPMKFRDRYELLKRSPMLASCPDVQVVEQTTCKGKEHFQEFYEGVLTLGGEGVMLRGADSAYEGRRSSQLLKYKPTKELVALVCGHTEGEGKHGGRCGALICLWGGVQFKVGTGLSDRQREVPPAVGEHVIVRYSSLTDAAVPRFPRFVRVADGDEGTGG